jgi:hypothetical protein
MNSFTDLIRQDFLRAKLYFDLFRTEREYTIRLGNYNRGVAKGDGLCFPYSVVALLLASKIGHMIEERGLGTGTYV